MSHNPFDPTRSPVSTPEVEAAIAERRARELAGREIVQCVACGDYDADDGSPRPQCRVCKRVRLYGTIVDRFVEFFFGPG